jgi:hypothetical protein
MPHRRWDILPYVLDMDDARKFSYYMNKIRMLFEIFFF